MMVVIELRRVALVKGEENERALSLSLEKKRGVRFLLDFFFFFFFCLRGAWIYKSDDVGSACTLHTLNLRRTG
jgi:hypothetical protein